MKDRSHSCLQDQAPLTAHGLDLPEMHMLAALNPAHAAQQHLTQDLRQV